MMGLSKAFSWKQIMFGKKSHQGSKHSKLCDLRLEVPVSIKFGYFPVLSRLIKRRGLMKNEEVNTFQPHRI